MDRSYSIGGRTTAVRVCDGRRVDGSFPGRQLWICDSNTRRFLPADEQAVVELPAGESGKNWESVTRIIDTALETPLGRDGTIVAVGGGVVCDVAAFAASIYMRGCGLVLVPTTLLAMVDASLGGKTGIDYRDYKNMVGSFYPAARILLYPAFLSTLSEPEYRSGLAEVLKHGMLESGTLFGELAEKRMGVLARNAGLLGELIPRSLAVKGRIVEEDPTEQGIRAHLNLGHTFGHALESVLGLGAVPHGHAVAWGIARVLEAGLELGETDAGWAEEAIGTLRAYGYDLEIGIPDLDAYLTTLARDKKQKGGAVRFVLQRRRGETFTAPLDRDLLLRVLSPYSS